MVSHGYSVRMLERCIQAVHKMGDLALKMASDEGEAEVLKRMELVDLARGLFNTIVIDKDGEDYGFQTYTMAGVKDILDGSCNMLSAVSQIPQTLLFGRSPAGENATGESDMENFYGFLGGLQKVSLKPAASRLIDVIFLAAKNTGKIDSVPKFKINFKPFWTLSDAEEADLDKAHADAAFVRAQAAALYVTNQVLMPEEVREGLKSSNDFNVENLVDDDESDWDIPDTPDTPPNLTVQATETPEQEKTPPNPSGDMGRSDGEEVHGVGVLVLDGDIIPAAPQTTPGRCGRCGTPRTLQRLSLGLHPLAQAAYMKPMNAAQTAATFTGTTIPTTSSARLPFLTDGRTSARQKIFRRIRERLYCRSLLLERKADRMEDRCVCCGAIVPEGRMVCPMCERSVDAEKAKVEGGDNNGKHHT